MFFTFSKKPNPPILSKNKDIHVAINAKPIKEKPVKMVNMFRLAQPTIGKCSACNSFR